eukprot:UN34560
MINPQFNGSISVNSSVSTSPRRYESGPGCNPTVFNRHASEESGSGRSDSELTSRTPSPCVSEKGFSEWNRSDNHSSSDEKSTTSVSPTPTKRKFPHRSKQKRIEEVQKEISTYFTKKGVYVPSDVDLRGEDTCRVHVKTYQSLNKIFEY